MSVYVFLGCGYCVSLVFSLLGGYYPDVLCGKAL
jgi:hypothetical protein